MHSCPLFQVVFTFSAAVASALTCSAAQMGNISSRVGVGTGDNVLITGFTVSTGLSAIVVRALGPSLSAYGIAVPLTDPVLEIHDSTGTVIATNDTWRDTQQQEFGPGGIYAAFRPGNESEPAIAITLPPGSYTAVVRGKNGTTGIALAEVYAATGNSIENVSSRALVGTGDDALIGGLITTGDTGEFVVRALGPSLAQFGVTNPLPNPRVELYDSNGQLIQYNDDWMDDQQQADQVDAKGLAPPNWLDSALVVTLAPGNYTAIVKAGDGNTSGVALLEVYGPLTSAKTTLASTRPVVNLRTEGAAGNGTTDDQAVITKAIAKAKSLGVPLYAPGGHTYAHSSYITLDGVSMYGDGDNTVFSASNAHAGALRLTGKNPSLKSLKVIYRSTPTTRLSRGTQTGVFMDHAAGFTVDNVTVANSPSAGILVFVSHGTATNYATVSNCRVKNTLADAYHCTGASSYVRLSGNSTTNPGDDMFAVVSYLGDGAQTHHITYSNNVGVWNRGTPNDSGRGMSVVGGNHITFNNNSVTNTEWAGVYLASESVAGGDGFDCYSVDTVTVQNCHIDKAAVDFPISGHAGIMTYGHAGGHTVSNITISGNTITNSANLGVDIRTFASSVVVAQNTITTTGLEGLLDRAQDVEFSNNTVSNTGSHGVKILSSATGFGKVLTNDFSKINYNTGRAADVINIASSSVLSSLTITNNTYHIDPVGWAGGLFINLNGFVGATVSGNRTIASTSQ